ncbi:FtsX-like permease family protein [candidate division WOR-3 bacterium]|uniref:Cell division protein FtsX n=1 Tax=candidate division WOR-3 bacterium TaxID=2052148 RepID=A0A937XHJ5_UNCW3|nr:FtsX-like permease family protein [candidate division WOR-3 bacterium]
MRPSHILQETFRSISRNRGSFVLAATVQAICLVLLSVFIILTWNLVRLSEAARRNVELYAFVADQADPMLLVQRIASLDGVAQARYVPKAEALTELRADLGSDSTLVDALEQNPLPPSVRITVRSGFASLSELAAMEQKIQLIPGVTEVWSGKEMVERLEVITRTVMFLDIGILVIVFCAVLFIAFQTVESSIASRHHEIQIMELVGATNATVRLPFLCEGTAQGMLGGAAAFVLAVLFHRLAAVVIPATALPVGIVLLADLGLGALSGVAGSLIALNRIHRAPQAVVTDDSEE